MRFVKWHSLFLVALVVVDYARAEQFQYFDKGIEYWHEPGPAAATTSKETPAGQSRFPWDKYLNPVNKEFFKEGDYTPPEPFMEIVRNPSDENLKMWFAYVEKKNELASTLELKMREYLAKNGNPVVAVDTERMMRKVKLEAPTNIDIKQFRFRLYFSSQCPHCQRMFATMRELQEKGFFVEARQVDKNPKGVVPLPFPTQMATQDEISRKDIQSVPVLLIGDLKKKLVYRLTGYQSTADVLGVLAQKRS